MNQEPARIIASITAAVTAVIALLVAYGLDISQEQQAAILGVVAVVAPLIAGIIIRNNVYSPQSTQDVAERAAVTGKAPKIV